MKDNTEISQLQSPLHLPSHDEGGKGEKQNRYADPRKKDAEIKTDARMCPEEDGTQRLDNCFILVLGVTLK